MKIWMLTAVALLGGVGYFWATSGQDNATNALTVEDVEAPETVKDTLKSEILPELPELPEIDVVASDIAKGDESSAQVAKSSESVVVQSPFSVVPDDEATNTPTNASTTGVQEANSSVVGVATLVDVERESTGNTQPIVVPRSFPITDAAKYYIPKDERGPGQLGGPPPLDFPGGPGDTSGTGNAFIPPAAP